MKSLKKCQDLGASNNYARVIVTSGVMAFTQFILWRKRLRFGGHAIWTNRIILGRCKSLQTTIIM